MSKPIIELDEGWSYMEKGFEKVKRVLELADETKFTSEEYMMLYTTIYNMCVQKPPHDYCQQLYVKYKEIQELYLDSTVMPSLKNKHGEFMLRELAERWATHKVMVRWLSRFFCYLDRFYVARNTATPLVEYGRKTFKDNVYEALKANAKDSLIELIDREREGEQIDKHPMKLMVNVFDEMGTVDGQVGVHCYDVDFEAHMVADSGEYYSRKASNWIVEDSCPEYMKKVDESLKKEKERVKNYLRTSTETKLLATVQQELLVVPMQQLLDKEDSGCRALLRGDKVEDLSMMFKLYNECRENNSVREGLDLASAVFKQHVTDAGKALVQQAEEAAAAGGGKKAAAGEEEPGDVLIRKLIELHEKYMGYVIGCFENHSLFHKSLKEAFEVFCNKKVAGSTSAELLAAFLDKILKDAGKSSNDDDDLDKNLDNIVQLLTYVNDKDLFAEFSRKKLGRRLLFDRANEEHEKAVLVKLKQQNGGQFTSKMQGMITDITVSKSSQLDFAEYVQNNGGPKPGLDFTVTVLTTGFWPSYSTCDLNLPEEMVKCVEAYKGFYDTSKKHRKLSWIYSLGSCHVKGNFVPKPIELIVTTYQAAILLLFNDAESLSFSEILTQSNLNKNDLIRLLHSLSCAKYKILLKEPNTKTISEKDTFMFNTKFTDKMRRIKVPLPPVDERKKVVEDVDKDRRFAIDAALVRIMKSRKVLGHQQLVQECIDILKAMFKPDIKAIKKRIEDLITRDYLERDSENPNTFKYLA